MNSESRDLSRYKKQLRDLKISHKEVAEYIGRTRENVTVWLGGKQPPLKVAIHVSEEIEELISKHSSSSNITKEKEKTALKRIKKIIDDLSNKN